MVNYKKALQLIEEAERRGQYVIPATPADAIRLERFKAQQGSPQSNEEWARAEDAAADADLTELNNLLAEGRYQECKPIIKRLGSRYKVPARLPRSQRPVCGAMTRKGTPCKARVVWLKGEPLPRDRCKNHGGLSTGPTTPEGKQAVAESNRRRAKERPNK